MEMETKQDFSFLKKLFFNIYSLNKIYEDRDVYNKNIMIPLSEEELKKKIIWYRVLDHTKNYSQIKNWLQEEEELSEIKIPGRRIRYKPSFPGYDLGYVNIVICERKIFRLNVHLKLIKKLTNTYNLIVIFSSWFEGPAAIDNLDLDFINTIFNDLLVGYRIITKLQDMGYLKVSLFDDYKIEHYNVSKHWLKNKPLIFITNGLELLNANPFKLIQSFKENLEELDSFIQNIEKDSFENSTQFFNYFSSELKDFLLKGKELFHFAEGSLDFISEINREKIREPYNISRSSRKSTGLTPETLLKIFNIAYENDRENNINIENRGYRSISKIHKDFGEKFGFSKQTAYNCLYNSNLESVLVNRMREDRGGGTEYCIKVVELAEDIDTDDLNERFMYEKMKIERALIYYNKKEFNNCINIFQDVLKSPSERLKEKSELYLGSKFYLAKSYFRSEDYGNALEILEDINKENENLFDVNYYLMVCHLELLNYDTLENLIQFNKTKIENLFNSFGIQYELHKFKEGIYKRKEFAQRMTEDDGLIKNILLINKATLDKRYGMWNVYNFPSKKEENSIAFDRLRKTLETALILQVELNRREIFRYVLKKNNSEVQKNIDNLLELLSSEIYRNMFNEHYFFSYLHYLKLLIRHQLKENNPKQFIELIKKYFPTFQLDSLEFARFPDKLNNISSFINEMNNLYTRQEREPFWGFSLKFNPKDPNLIFEKIYTEGYLIEEYNLLDKTKCEEAINDMRDIDDLDKLLEIWERFLFSFFIYGTINRLPENFRSTEKVLKKHNLDELSKYLEDIYNGISKKVTIINDLIEIGKNDTMKKIFKVLSKIYVFKERDKITFTVDKLPKGIGIDEFTFDRVFPEINKMMPKSDYNGKFEFEMNLPNKEISEIVFNYYNNMGIQFSNRDQFFPQQISDTQILLTNESFVYYFLDGSYKDDLNNTLEGLVKIVRRNFNYFIGKSKKFHDF